MWILWACLIGFTAAIAFQKIQALDYFWHLRTGATIAKDFAVPKVDPFTYTISGEPWINPHWLFQLGLYGLHLMGAEWATITGKAVLLLLLVAIVGRIGFHRQRPLVTVVALTLMLVVASQRFFVRPDVVSFVLLGVTMALLDRFERRGDGWIYAMVGVELLWANVQGLFPLGVAVCGAALVGELLRPLLNGNLLRRPRVRRLAAVTALTALVTLVNPNGMGGVAFAMGLVRFSQNIYGGKVISREIVSPFDPDAGLNGLALSLFLLLAGLSLAAMILNRGRLRHSDVLVWGSILYLALTAQRNTAIFAVVAAPILVRNLNTFLDQRGIRAFSPGVRTIGAVLGSLVLVVLTADVLRDRFYSRIGAYGESGVGLVQRSFPVGATDWIVRHRPPGPICHHMANGGYLMWHLYPNYKVMIDGRVDVFGPKFTELQIYNPSSFKVLDEEEDYHFGVVLVQYAHLDFKDAIFWLQESQNPEWRLVFVDDVACLFVRSTDANASLGVDLDAPDLFAPLDPVDGMDQLWRYKARRNFYLAMRRPKQALAVWEEALELYPQIVGRSVEHARLLFLCGEAERADLMLRSMAAQHSRDAPLLARVGARRLEMNQFDAARQVLDAALAIDSDLPRAIYERARLAEIDGDNEMAKHLYRRILTERPSSRWHLRAVQRLRALNEAGGSSPRAP